MANSIEIKKLSIIVPVYNERATVGRLLDKLEKLELPAEKEIIAVDDGSTDGSREILRAREKNCRVIYQQRNYGKGRAILTGLAAASGDYVVIQDADLEYDPEDFKLMLKKISESGGRVVYGSRRLQHSYFKSRHSGHIFALGGIFLTWLTNFLYGASITDEPTCYKMFKTDLLKELDLKCRGFEFCPEATAKILKRGIKILEVPISYQPRHKADGKKINWRDALIAAWTLIRYRFLK